jgi:methylmalonyl-CoA/ethylmalonyl-CoA epimerase
MKQGIVEANAIMQVAIIVRDIEKVSQMYALFFGVAAPVWFYSDPPEKAQTIFRGEASEVRTKHAFFPLGQIQLELVEPDEHPSTWREHLDRYGEGLHHVAFRVDSMEKTVESMERLSMPVIQSGDFTGGTYTNMETFEQLKLPIELLAFQQSAEKNE